MNAKQEAIETIKGLPESATIDDIMQELFNIAKINKGLDDEANGRIISHEEAKKRLEKWLPK